MYLFLSLVCYNIDLKYIKIPVFVAQSSLVVDLLVSKRVSHLLLLSICLSVHLSVYNTQCIFCSHNDCISLQFYHACDQPGVTVMCIMDYDTLQFCDFLGFCVSVWVTIVCMHGSWIQSICKYYIVYILLVLQMINRIQNKGFCLHYICMCTVYYVYINTHTCYIYLRKYVMLIYK